MPKTKMTPKVIREEFRIVLFKVDPKKTTTPINTNKNETEARFLLKTNSNPPVLSTNNNKIILSKNFSFIV